ncbi:MAG: hypothetical protein HQL69_02195 [Magnetococcales bacterium]|nr:hypothetical protein [Magnetococcales bacterium]
MPQFKKVFGPLVFVLTFSIANGWGSDLKKDSGAYASPGLSGESVFIPLSNRNPTVLQPGSSYGALDSPSIPSSIQGGNPPAASGLYQKNPPSASSFYPKTEGSKTPVTNNRFWDPPPEFRNEGGTTITNDPEFSYEGGTTTGGGEWSSTPPPSIEWGDVGITKPRMAKENDPRFDYSEPEDSRNGLSIYEDPQGYKKQFSEGSRGYEINRWQDGGYDRPKAGSSVWGGEPMANPNAKIDDQFDYSDVDDYEPPQKKRSYKNFYNTLEPPPQGTYGNQWR